MQRHLSGFSCTHSLHSLPAYSIFWASYFSCLPPTFSSLPVDTQTPWTSSQTFAYIFAAMFALALMDRTDCALGSMVAFGSSHGRR